MPDLSQLATLDLKSMLIVVVVFLVLQKLGIKLPTNPTPSPGPGPTPDPGPLPANPDENDLLRLIPPPFRGLANVGLQVLRLIFRNELANRPPIGPPAAVLETLATPLAAAPPVETSVRIDNGEYVISTSNGQTIRLPVVSPTATKPAA